MYIHAKCRADIRQGIDGRAAKNVENGQKMSRDLSTMGQTTTGNKPLPEARARTKTHFTCGRPMGHRGRRRPQTTAVAGSKIATPIQRSDLRTVEGSRTSISFVVWMHLKIPLCCLSVGWQKMVAASMQPRILPRQSSRSASRLRLLENFWKGSDHA